MILINAQKKCKKNTPQNIKKTPQNTTENTPKTNLKYLMHADIFFIFIKSWKCAFGLNVYLYKHILFHTHCSI